MSTNEITKQEQKCTCPGCGSIVWEEPVARPHRRRCVHCITLYRITTNEAGRVVLTKLD